MENHSIINKGPTEMKIKNVCIYWVQAVVIRLIFSSNKTTTMINLYCKNYILAKKVRFYILNFDINKYNFTNSFI